MKIFNAFLSSLVASSSAALLRSKQHPRQLQRRIAANTNPCSLIAIVMDESGSMSGEQEFLRNEAMPEVVSQLKLALEKEVFVCTYGYGGYHEGSSEDPHIEGCSEGFDVNDYGFIADGGTEDGWKAIEFAHTHSTSLTVIDNITLSTHCQSMNKYMILVTDEDRDDTGPQTFNSTLELLKDNDWSLHAILNQALIPSESIGAAKNENDTWTYYTATTDANGNPDYDETITSTDPIGLGDGDTETHYVPLAFETDGAVWNLNKLRAGGTFVSESFSKAFKEISVSKIARAEAICRDVIKDESCTAVVTPEEINNGSTGTLSVSPVRPYKNGDVVTLSAELNGVIDTCEATISVIGVCPKAICKNVTKDDICTTEVTAAEVNNGSTGSSFLLSPPGPYSNGDIVTLTAEFDGDTDTCEATVSVTGVCPQAICRNVTKDDSCTTEVTAAEVNNGSTGSSFSLWPTGPFSDGDVVTLTAEFDGETDTCEATVFLTGVCPDDICATAPKCSLFFGKIPGVRVHMNMFGGCFDFCVPNLIDELLSNVGSECGNCP